MERHVRVAAVIPAAWIGHRMNLTQPKQYLRIANTTVLEHSVAVIEHNRRIEAIDIAVAPIDPFIQRLQLTPSERVRIELGERGNAQAASVYAGVTAAHTAGYQWDAVHAAARACLQDDELARVL